MTESESLVTAVPLHESNDDAPNPQSNSPTREEAFALSQPDNRPRPYYYTPPLWSMSNLWTILRTRNLPGEPDSGHKPDCCFDDRLIPKWTVLYDALLNLKFLFMDTPETSFRKDIYSFVHPT